jgi:hypothetical protein
LTPTARRAVKEATALVQFGLTSFEKFQMRSSWVSLLVSLVFYTIIAGAFAELMEGGWKEFRWIFGIMVAVRTAYGVLEFLESVVVWQIYGRRATVNSFVVVMREAKFPKRVYGSDSADNYFHRIREPSVNDYKEGEVTPDIQRLAAEMNTMWETIRYQHGWRAEMRIGDALRRAVDIYTPIKDSPPFVSPSLLWGLREDAVESELTVLPNMKVELAKALIRDRPFDTNRELYDYLRIRGLDDHSAIIFMIEASKFYETKRTKQWA